MVSFQLITFQSSSQVLASVSVGELAWRFKGQKAPGIYILLCLVLTKFVLNLEPQAADCDFLSLKRTNSNFKPLLGGNWPQTIKEKLNQLKNWHNKFFSVFQNSHFLTPHWPLFSLNFHPFGTYQFFWNVPQVKAYTSRSKMVQFSLMVSKVKPNHISCQGCLQFLFLFSSFEEFYL